MEAPRLDGKQICNPWCEVCLIYLYREQGPVEVSTYVIVVLDVKKRFAEKYMVTFNI